MLHYEVYIFIITYKLKKPAKKSFHVFSFDDTEERVAVRFEGDDSLVYTVTLCQYLDPENELHIDPGIKKNIIKDG